MDKLYCPNMSNVIRMINCIAALNSFHKVGSLKNCVVIYGYRVSVLGGFHLHCLLDTSNIFKQIFYAA
jgi:hypothetical protein